MLPPLRGERCLVDLSLIDRLLGFGVRCSLKGVGVVFLEKEGAVLVNFDEEAIFLSFAFGDLLREVGE